MNTIFNKLTTKQPLIDFFLAVSFLTRIPIPDVLKFENELMSAAWSFSLIGALLGFLCGSIAWVLLYLNIPIGIVAFLTVGSMILLTGGIHEDGLADMADGVGGGKSADEKIAIMRDSQIGTYGALSLIFMLGMKVTAIDIILNNHTILVCIISLVISGALSRLSMVTVAFLFENASKTGLGHFAGKPTLNSIVMPLIILTLISLLLLPILKLIIIILLCVLTTIVIGKFSKQQIGGYTGDILGATQVVSEVVILIYLATY